MNLHEALNKIEGGIVDVAAKAGPILAPIPAAYAVSNAARNVLGWPVTVATIAGAAIECLGVASLNTALQLRSYNRDKRKSDPSAPFGLAVGAAAFYVVVAVALVLTFEPASAVFPFLSLAGALILALRADHRRRLAEIAETKADMSRKRTERRNRKRAEVEAEVPLPATRKRKAAVTGNGAETREKAAAILAENPDISGAELGRMIGRSGRMGRLLKAELLPEMGAVSVPGGNGNEVVL